MKKSLTILVAVVLLVGLSIDGCSRHKVPRSNAEALLYAAWQKVVYGGNTDHFEK
jgi:hypothetical protein